MSRAGVDSSKYSPGNMRPEALETLFVGKEREKLLKDLLKKIAASAKSSDKHFALLVAPRGMGKTHFLGLLHHRLCTAPELAPARKKLKVALLNEEEWGVASFLDFLTCILRALALDDGSIDRRIDEIHQTFTRDPERAREIAERHLIEVVGQKTLLLMCENLSDLFDGLGDEGQRRLRAFIQERGFFAIVATTPALFRDVQHRESPFHGFFTIRSLDRLDFETALELLQKKAEIEDRKDLALKLGRPDGRARARAIHHLARGNARVYVAMSEFLDRESLDDLVDPFMRVIDDLTPYYQERMRQLTSPQQRKIVDFLSRARGSAAVKEVAARCLMSQQVAAKQLGELAKSGVVRSEKDGRETRYELAEPLMRICIEVKDNRTKHLRSFVDFLRDWFSAQELRGHLAGIESATDREVDRLHTRIALEEAALDRQHPLLDALLEEARRCLGAKDLEGAIALGERLVRERGDEADFGIYAESLCEADRFSEAIEALHLGLERYPTNAFLHWLLAKALRSSGRWLDFETSIQRWSELDPESTQPDVELALGFYRQSRYLESLDVLDRVGARIDEDLLLLLRANALIALNRLEDLLALANRRLERTPNSAMACRIAANALNVLNRAPEAESLVRTRRAAGELDSKLSQTLANAIRAQGRIDEAITTIDDARRRYPADRMLAQFQVEQLKDARRFEEALATLDAAEKNRALSAADSFRLRLQVLRAAGRWDEIIKMLGAPGPKESAISAYMRGVVHMRAGRRNQAAASWRSLKFIYGGLEHDERADAAAGLLKLGLAEDALELLRGQGSGLGVPLANRIAARSLIRLRRYQEARVASAAAGHHAASTRLGIITGELGLGSALREGLEPLLKEPRPAAELAELLLVESVERGPVSMARQADTVTQALDRAGGRSLWPRALTALVRLLAQENKYSDAGWTEAIEILRASLSGVEGCEIPLSALAAMARFASTGDRGGLLDLPLELRSLLVPIEDEPGSARVA